MIGRNNQLNILEQERLNAFCKITGLDITSIDDQKKFYEANRFAIKSALKVYSSSEYKHIPTQSQQLMIDRNKRILELFK